MIKKILLTLGALVTLGVTVITVLGILANNPYELEPERLGPKGDETIPPIVAVRNAKNYLLYPAHAENIYVIHLPLPNHYIHESNTTGRILKSYSVSASMYYPELNGKFYPGNANLPNCNGYCGGYVRVFIEPNQNTAHVMNEHVLERIKHDRQQDSPLLKFEGLDPEFGIGEHFQIRYPAIEAKSKGAKGSTKEYLIKRDGNGEVEYMFECSPYAPSPACGVKFNLSSRPELVVDIRFGRDLMSNWQNIIQSVDAKIASWRPTRIEIAKK